jgi:hypothetical protein
VALVHSCLAKDPDKRPTNARAVAEALAVFSSEGGPSSDDVAVVPSRPSLPRLGSALLGQLRQRKRVAAVTAGALGAGAVILFAATRRSHEEAVPVSTPEPVHAAAPPPATVASAVPVELPTPASAQGAPMPAGLSIPIAPHDNTTAHRVADPARPPPAASSRPAAKPQPRPSPGKATGRRPSTEDDDRIE